MWSVTRLRISSCVLFYYILGEMLPSFQYFFEACKSWPITSEKLQRI